MLDEHMDGEHVLNIWNIYNTTCNSPYYQLLSLSWADNSPFEWNPVKYVNILKVKWFC